MMESLEGRQLLATGNGLAAVYFDNADLSGRAVARTDAAVNFNWKDGAPAKRFGADTFSARWTGQVQARFSQEYTFSTVSDDGVRLWVNGQLLIDQWNDHAAQIDRGRIVLKQGRRYDIKMEYYERSGGALAELWWNSHTQRGGIVPKAFLFSDAPVTPPSSDDVPTPEPEKVGAVRVSSNGRYLVKEDGSPFFYLADTAWQMPRRLGRSDVDYYMKTRAAQGFNVVQTVAVDSDYWEANAYGQVPLINNNPNTPNDAFFAHVDYIVAKAGQYGITVALMPTWGKNVAVSDRRIFTPASAYDYGRYLGRRYRNVENLIWINGGDHSVNDATTAAIWRSLAEGLTDGDGGRHLMTFHPRGGETARQDFPNESWMDFSMVQSGHARDSSSWALVGGEYRRNPVMPVIEGEPNYERIPLDVFKPGPPSKTLLDDYDVRKKAYWDIFAGAAGTAYGANEVFQFYQDGRVPDYGASMDWREALELTGAKQMKFLRRLMESRSYVSRVPDQSVVTSKTYTGTDHIQATRDAGGSFAMVYTGSGQAFTVNMAKITNGDVVANWYNPKTGKRTRIGVFENAGTRTFRPPTRGYGHDWVLTLDRA